VSTINYNPSIQEILVCNDSYCPKFTVNTTGVLSVALSASTSHPSEFYPSDGGPTTTGTIPSWFAQGDTLQIVGYGINLPYNFQFADEATGVGGVATSSYPSFGICINNTLVTVNNAGGTPVIRENVYISCNITVNWNYVANFVGTGPYWLTCALEAASISMLNVPSALNGLVFYARPFIDVIHNLPLVT